MLTWPARVSEERAELVCMRPAAVLSRKRQLKRLQPQQWPGSRSAYLQP